MKKEALKTFAKRLDNAPKVHFMCCDNIKACAIVTLYLHFLIPICGSGGSFQNSTHL